MGIERPGMDQPGEVTLEATLSPRPSDWPSFVERVQRSLGTGKGLQARAETLHAMNCLLASEFHISTEREEHLLITDGLVVTAGKSSIQGTDTLAVHWRGDFYPAPRWPRPDGDYVPLGCFGKYDLYCGYRHPESTVTLIAVYGDGPGDFYAPPSPPSDFEIAEIMCGRKVASTPRLAMPTPLLVEATRRAQLLNIYDEVILQHLLSGWR